MISTGRPFYQTFQTKPEETVGRNFFELGNRQWDIPRLRELIETVLPKNTSFEEMEVEHDFPAIGHRKMLLIGRQIVGETGRPQLVLLTMEDVTGK